MIQEDYKKIAKDFGIKFRIGRFGIKFFPRDPGGKIYKLVQITPLDGWITDKKEIIRAIRLDDNLGIAPNTKDQEVK